MGLRALQTHRQRRLGHVDSQVVQLVEQLAGTLLQVSALQGSSSNRGVKQGPQNNVQ